MKQNVTEIILASGSIYRRKLLESTGLNFRVETSRIDEEQIQVDIPAELAMARALAKSAEVAVRFPGALIIGADQVLGFEGKSYGKAVDAREARMRLTQFSGRTHTLHSAYVLAWKPPAISSAKNTGGSNALVKRIVDVAMTMRSLSEAEIDAYVATGEWKGCAGCYQAENRGVHLMSAPLGESSSIIGLPLPELLADLRALGVNGLLNPAGPWDLKHLF